MKKFILFFAAILISVISFCQLTLSQLSTLKTDITVTNAATSFNGSTLLTLWNGNDFENLAAYYNTTASPQLDLWRPDIAPSDIIPVIVMSEFIALTAVKQNGLLLYMQGSVINATNANVRNGFTSIFTSGTSLTNLTALAKKAATNLEKLFTVSNVSPLYKYTVSGNELSKAKFN